MVSRWLGGCSGPQLPEGVESPFKQNTVLPVATTEPKKSNTYLTEAGFLARGNYALDLAKEGVKEIESGYIKPSPFVGACMRCDFADVCAYRDAYPRTKYSVNGAVFETYNLNEETEGNNLGVSRDDEGGTK